MRLICKVFQLALVLNVYLVTLGELYKVTFQTRNLSVSVCIDSIVFCFFARNIHWGDMSCGGILSLRQGGEEKLLTGYTLPGIKRHFFMQQCISPAGPQNT